jgi:hypothetical protein
MARKKSKKAAARTARKPVRKALGFLPEQHKKRNADFEADARRFLREVSTEIDSGRCEIAFSRLIDGVSYAGMAEAEAQGAGGDSAAIASLAAAAIKSFRKSCKVG